MSSSRAGPYNPGEANEKEPVDLADPQRPGTRAKTRRLVAETLTRLRHAYRPGRMGG